MCDHRHHLHHLRRVRDLGQRGGRRHDGREDGLRDLPRHLRERRVGGGGHRVRGRDAPHRRGRGPERDRERDHPDRPLVG
ncbi:MAG: hypothetical protein ACK559_27600, partial [bacterium]